MTACLLVTEIIFRKFCNWPRCCFQNACTEHVLGSQFKQFWVTL